MNHNASILPLFKKNLDNESFWMSLKSTFWAFKQSWTRCPNWGEGGNLDKIQKNSNFFSWNLPIGLTKYFDFLIKCICILRFFNGKLRQDYESYYSYFLLLTAWIEEKSWNGHNYIIWPPPTVHYVVVPGSQNVHQHHCWDGNCIFVTNLYKPF